MIVIRNRKMVIPYEDVYIGTSYDTNTEIRMFKVQRYTSNHKDLAALNFRLDLRYNITDQNAADTVMLSKEVHDDYILLKWEITESVLQAPGTAFINLRASENGTNRWSTFIAAVYIGHTLYTPGSYTGSLTEIEQMEANYDHFKQVIEDLEPLVNLTDTAEAWAVGQRNGHDVASSDITYHNNAKYYSGTAMYAAEDSENFRNLSQAYAEGKIGSQDVDSDDPAYHNNAKYYRDNAATSASLSVAMGETAEAWAEGEINDDPVDSSHPAYHNNAKYYAEQASYHSNAALTFSGNANDFSVAAAASASAAANSAENAAASEDNAEASASAAQASDASAANYSRDSEAWAVGQRNGSNVGTSDVAYHNNAKYYSEQADAFSNLAGAHKDAAQLAAQQAAASATSAAGSALDASDYADQAAASAASLTVDAALSDTSTNPVQNKVIKQAIDSITIETDDTLSVTGAAADAKKTGDEIADVKSAIDEVEEKVSDGKAYPYAVVDKYGKAALTIDDDGFTRLNQKFFKVDESGLHSTDAEGNDLAEYKSKGLFDFALCDRNGRIAFYVDNGKIVAPSANIKNLDNPDINAINAQILQSKQEKEANFDSELNMFIAYGQSWSVGYDAAAITLTPMYDNVMFDTGIKNNPLSDMSIVPTSFVPMVEFTGANADPQTMTCGETPVSAMCRMVKQLIEDENGYVYTDFPYQLLGNAPGYGDRTLAQLAKGTIYYDRLINQVQYAYNIASGLGKKLVVQAFTWQQYAKGSISGDYPDLLEQLRSDIDTDVKAITGQTQNVKCITWQTFNITATGGADCYDKYVGASETYPDIICSGASYQFRHVASGNLHLIATDNDWAGAYFGLAYKRTIVDGEKFVPLKPIKAERHSNVCILTFHVPVKPLAFDTDTVASAPNMGFTLLTSGGEEKTITGVEIIAPDKIKITASASIEATDRIAYGQNASTAFGPVNGNRGNVRDSQGNNIKCTAGDGTVFALHNWLVIFDKAINSMEV